MHAQSHDNDYAARRELQHAFYFTRAGIPLVYTDGNYHAGLLSQWRRISQTCKYCFPWTIWVTLGCPTSARLHQDFARGYQIGRWSDDDFVAYERVDKRENPSMGDPDGVTMLILINDNYASGQARSFSTSFPSQAGTQADAYLFQYARGPDGTGQVGFYTHALSNLNQVRKPPGGYYIFSWRTPESAPQWEQRWWRSYTIHQDGHPWDAFRLKDETGLMEIRALTHKAYQMRTIPTMPTPPAYLA